MIDSDGATGKVDLDQLIKIAGDLNEFVVAFDQIFSRIAFGEADSALLVEFMTERNVRERIARARSVLFDSLEQVIGPESADKIAEDGYRHFG